MVTAVEPSRALHSAIPGATSAALDTGHLGRLEQPDLVAATIRKFLWCSKAIASTAVVTG
jgi:hypothetical protein